MRNLARLAIVGGAVIAMASHPAQSGFLPRVEVETQAGPTTESLHVLGATAYLMDGTELGDVVDTKIGDHGDVSEIHVAVATPLGLGGKTIAIPISRCITLRGAVIVEMSTSELAKLPAVVGR